MSMAKKEKKVEKKWLIKRVRIFKIFSVYVVKKHLCVVKKKRDGWN